MCSQHGTNTPEETALRSGASLCSVDSTRGCAGWSFPEQLKNCVNWHEVQISILFHSWSSILDWLIVAATGVAVLFVAKFLLAEKILGAVANVVRAAKQIVQVTAEVVQHFSYTLSISFIGTANESWFRTPDIADNLSMFGYRRGTEDYSYSKFRVKLRILASCDIGIGIDMYAFASAATLTSGYESTPDLRELLGSGTYIPSLNAVMQRNIQEFKEDHSKDQPKSSISDGYRINNGNTNRSITVSKGDAANVVIARIGMSAMTQSPSRTINVTKYDTKYCDVLIILKIIAEQGINTTDVALLCSLPEFYNDENNFASSVPLKEIPRPSKE
jgi:hypothetical protein